MISRCIVRAKGYHLPGFFISISVFNSSFSVPLLAFVFVEVLVEFFSFFFFVFFFSVAAVLVTVVVEEEVAYDLKTDDNDIDDDDDDDDDDGEVREEW
jgi:hypothetical protein